MPLVTQASPIWPTAGAPTSGITPTPNLIALCNYYVLRLVLQYRDKPNAQRLIALFVKKILADDLATGVLNAYGVTTAVGPQLDIIGKYVGVNRNIGPATLPPLFGLVDYNSSNPQGVNGFALYNGSSPATGAFYTYSQAAAPATALSDSQYAFVLQLQIGLNMMDGTLSGIQNFIATFLPGIVSVVDNQNMTLTYSVSVYAPISPTLITQFLPKPMGVGINVIYTTTRITFSGATRITSNGNTRVTS